MKNKTIRKSRFTLIELLVVIGIIGILTGILLPAISGSMKEGRKAKAAATARQLAQAIDAYMAEYGSLPIDPTATTDQTETVGPSTGGTFLGYLGGNNVRGKSFFDNDGTVSHPYNQNYTIIMDGDYNNSVSASGDTVNGSVAVFTTCDGDTVKSWDK